MDELKITIIQSDLVWEDAASNIKLFSDKLSKISKSETVIIVLPEMFSSGFTMNTEKCFQTMDGEVVNWMKNISVEKQAVICGSLIIKENHKFYNRFIWAQPDGKLVTYDKNHLFRLSDEHLNFEPGNKRIIINYKGWNICPMICFDLRFPIYCRQKFNDFETYRGEYDLLLFVASWPKTRILAWQTLLQARAIENQAYVVGANRVGVDGNQAEHNGASTIINPLGEVINSFTDFEQIFTTTLSLPKLIKIRRAYQFWQNADEFILKK